MWAVALLLAHSTSVKFSVDQFAGLNLSVNGVPVLAGSSFNYLDPKTGRTLYSSRWSPKQVSQLPTGATQVRFSGDNGNVIGTHTYTPTDRGVQVRYEFRWRGSADARVDNCIAQVWAPAVAHGRVKVDDLELFSILKPVLGDWDLRRLAAGGRFEFDAPFLTMTAKLKNSRAALHDARAYAQDWAKGNCLLWLGQKGLTVKPNQTTEVVVDWEFDTRLVSPGGNAAPTLEGRPLREAVSVSPPFPVECEPKSRTQTGSFVSLSSGQATGATKMLADRLAKWWDIDPTAITLPIEEREDAQLPPEGFEIATDMSGIRLSYRDAAGLKYALDALALSARPQGGKLVIPCGVVRDWPSVSWRGVHVFGGVRSLPFLTDYADRVLGPVRFNRAVVECSRAKWSVVDKEKSADWVDLGQLGKVFENLKTAGIEPIPLVQSLGHMEWLLDGSRRNLAVYPEPAYILDYRKKDARDLIKSLWSEVLETLRPKTVHLGMDEIAMRGMTDDPTLPRRLWRSAFQELAPLVKSKGADIMIWGDMMLSPGEAADATHAKSAAEAEEFRSAVPKGTWIGDWHYTPAKSDRPYPSLSLWPTLGLRPIATSWYRPDNVAGYTKAAIDANAGTLQATWAGYTTDEKAAIVEPDQFAAHLLSAQNAWSGTGGTLGNARRLLRDLLWSPKRVVLPRPGFTWSDSSQQGQDIRIGSAAFRQISAIGLFSPLAVEAQRGPQFIKLAVATTGRRVAMALDCVGWQKDGDPVATVTVVTDRGRTSKDVLYGADVRAPEDVRDTVRCEREGAFSSFWIELGQTETIQAIEIESTSLTAGLRVNGITTS